MLSQGEVLEARHLPMIQSAAPAAAGHAPPASPATTPRTAESDLLPLREMERRHVERVLTAVGWNKRKACAVLEISRPTLDRKIDDFGLVRPAGRGAEEDEP